MDNTNYLITGYHGTPHVTAENDRGINAGAFGVGRFVLPVGEQFRAEYIGNNTVRMYDGKLMNNGAAAGIPVGEYIDIPIPNAGADKTRHDLIVFQYKKDDSTLIERGTFMLIQGTEGGGDPALTQADLLSGNATFDQMALWRVKVTGTTISTPERVTPIRGQMNVGAEHKTADFWFYKPIYTKIIEYTPSLDIGNAGDTYGFAITFSTPNFSELVRYCGTISGENGTAIPSFNTEAGGGYIGVNYMNSGGIALAMNKKVIENGKSIRLQVWYTKQ